MKKFFILIFTVMIGTSTFAQPLSEQDLQEKVNDLVAELTLEEKAMLCSGRDIWSTNPVERLDIPWVWMADGPHGVRRAPETDKWGFGDQLAATCFPTASALAATWDKELVQKVGETLGYEAQARDVNILLGPGTNIKRSLLGGRNFEYFSEDPILSGEMAAAFINGVQSQGVGTSLKHYVANNQETSRMRRNSSVDERTLHEVYLRPFEIAVKKAQPWTIMACYNQVMGEYGTQSPYLLHEILKERWGFKGIVISDWEAVIDRVKALKAGMHLQMPGHEAAYTGKQIVKAVQAGDLDESVLDEIVSETLRIVLLADSHEKENVKRQEEKHHQFARRVASEAITLLKNKEKTLPLTTGKYDKIAIIGEFATNPRYQGSGSSEIKPTQLDKALEVIQNEYGQDFEITYARGYNLQDHSDESLIAEAQKKAEEADVAVVFTGLPPEFETEGRDRTHLRMPETHNKLVSEVAAAQENTVVVMTNGSAVLMPWLDEVSGLLEAWLGGQAGAGGISDVLFGKVNPSGKLAETFPKRHEDMPTYHNFPGESREVLYGERVFVGYRYLDERKLEPEFPFGFGLSYTSFAYSDMEVSSKTITDKDELQVTATITNTGDVAGKEAVQLYVTDPESRLRRPEKELKSFTKVALEPGESKEITFTLSSRDFSYYDPRRDMWIAESGEFHLKLGASARHIKLTETITLESTQEVPLAFDEYTFVKAFWEHEGTRALLKEMASEWLQSTTVGGMTVEQALQTPFIGDQPIIKLPRFSGGQVTKAQVQELVEQTKDMTFTP